MLSRASVPPADSARFNRPSGLCLCPDGSVLVTEGDGHCVRRYDWQSGTVTTLAGRPVQTKPRPWSLLASALNAIG